MAQQKYNILPINDPSDSYFIEHDLFNLPARVLIVGRSQVSGKTTLLINLLARFYKEHFAPEDIWVISKTVNQEKMKKIVDYLQIPEDNLYNKFEPKILEAIYEGIKEEFKKDKLDGETPTHKLFIFDDMAYSNIFSSSASHTDNIMDELFCNSRHYLVTVIVIAQKYTQISTTLRENASALVIFESSSKQLELIADDHATTDKKTFMQEAKKATKKKHDFLFISYSNKTGNRFHHNFDTPIMNQEIAPPDNHQEIAPIDMRVDELPKKKSKKKKKLSQLTS